MPGELLPSLLPILIVAAFVFLAVILKASSRKSPRIPQPRAFFGGRSVRRGPLPPPMMSSDDSFLYPGYQAQMLNEQFQETLHHSPPHHHMPSSPMDNLVPPSGWISSDTSDGTRSQDSNSWPVDPDTRSSDSGSSSDCSSPADSGSSFDSGSSSTDSSSSSDSGSSFDSGSSSSDSSSS
jgi:hypothetical protein